MTISTIFVLVATVLSVVAIALAQGRDITAWAVLCLCVALIVSGNVLQR